jgi:GT2 family glycosyltransferase
MAGVDVSVCVPVYREHGEPNLGTLAASMHGALAGLRGELIVALNGISAPAAGVPDWATAIDLGTNRGVAPGWNAAASSAGGEVVVFANDDLALGQGSLALLREVLLSHADAGVVAPEGSRWDFSKPRHLGLIDTSERTRGELTPVDVVCGFLFAMRREVYDAAGGFDEAYAPCSMEEVDFCVTVSRRLGLSCYAAAGVEVEHEYGISVATPWKRIRHNGRSELLRSVHVRNVRHFRDKWEGIV